MAASKYDYEEIFLFLGTDTEDTGKLGAEVEFWLGEGNDMEKVVVTTSSRPYTFPRDWPISLKYGKMCSGR
jgi:hypothetical protein